MSKRKVRGGSIASDRVNVLSPKLCNCNYQYPDAVRSVMAKDFVVKIIKLSKTKFFRIFSNIFLNF